MKKFRALSLFAIAIGGILTIINSAYADCNAVIPATVTLVNKTNVGLYVRHSISSCSYINVQPNDIFMLDLGESKTLALTNIGCPSDDSNNMVNYYVSSGPVASLKKGIMTNQGYFSVTLSNREAGSCNQSSPHRNKLELRVTQTAVDITSVDKSNLSSALNIDSTLNPTGSGNNTIDIVNN